MEKEQRFSERKKRKPRHRRRKNKVPAPLVEEAIREAHYNFNEEEKYQQDIENSEGIKRADAEHDKVQKALSLEFEGFVWNIPFTVSAKELVSYLRGVLDEQQAIVRCQILVKNGRSSGQAVILFRNRRHFKTLSDYSQSLTLMFRGRKLNIKEGTGDSKRKRSIKSSPVSFTGKSLQLCLPVSSESASPLLLWNSPYSNDVKLVIDPSKRCIIIRFSAGAGLQVREQEAHISFKRIRHVAIGEYDSNSDKSSGNKGNNGGDIVVSLLLQDPPRLYCKKSEANKSECENEFTFESLLQEAFSVSAFRGASKTAFLWEVDMMDMTKEGGDEEWVRCLDLSQEKPFGQCLHYRITLSATGEDSCLSQQRIFDAFRDSALLTRAARTKRMSTRFGQLNVCSVPPPDMSLANSYSINSINRSSECLYASVMQQVWRVLGRRLPFITLYWLHCLMGACKVNLVYLCCANVSALQNLSYVCSQWPAVEVNGLLKELFLDLRCFFIHDLAATIKRELSGSAAGVSNEDSSDTGDGSGDHVNIAKSSEFSDNTSATVITAAAGGVREEERGGVWEMIDEESSNSSGSDMLIRRVLITPLRVCPQPPEWEQSNRVLRQFAPHLNRFIRVVFVDDNFGSVLQARSEEVYERRLRSVMTQGVVVGGQHFVFLAFSSSQLREQSCWFYCESTADDSDEGAASASAVCCPTAQFIRDWIGELTSIKIIGKFAARLGQGFSTTTPAATFPEDDVFTAPDVLRNGYCFSDGVGMIAASRARQIAESLGLEEGHIPSAFQIRFGGGKGMLTTVPDGFRGLGGRQMALRDSMMKYESTSRELCINSYSKAMPMYLNRQLITILSSRGIGDGVFMDLLQGMTGAMDAALTDSEAAKDLLWRHAAVGDSEHSLLPTTSAWYLLDSGVDISSSLYLQGLLRAVRNLLLLSLQMKARIVVPEGVCLIGVMDETHTLQPGEVFLQLSDQWLSNCSGSSGSGSGDKDDSPKNPARHGGAHHVLAVPSVVVGRNPSLHPGDVQVLTPTDVPALSHLVDILVFPATGPRPHCHEMSGGDLDGDIYFVSWDSRLIPKTAYEPMSYSAPSVTSLPLESQTESGVTAQDMGNFFVNYIKNDNLGQIANAHMACADLSPEGARCLECLQLAELHSTAVDFVKTGVPAQISYSLIRAASTFPSFMKTPSNQGHKKFYRSEKILGRIYDFCYASTSRAGSGKKKGLSVEHFDHAFLVSGFEVYVSEAEECLVEYNSRLWELMQHYGILDEMELLSGAVAQFSRRVAPKGGKGQADAQGKLNKAIKILRNDFRDMFWDELVESYLSLSSSSKTLKELDQCTHPCREDDVATPGATTTTTAADATPTPTERTYQDNLSLWRESSALQSEARKKASAWYYCAYYNNDNGVSSSSNSNDYTDEKMTNTLISFPWIVFNILCAIYKETSK